MEGEKRIEAICKQVPDFEGLFNARVRHYVIKDHILNVFNQFEKYFSRGFTDEKIEEFRLFLLLHDIGKSSAYKQGNRDNQFNATIDAIQKYQKDLGIPQESLIFYKSLLGASLIGKYMEGKVSLDDALANISSESINANLPINTFFYFLVVYYQCDVASYTSDAGGLAYLEHLFEYQNGLKVYCEKTKLLHFRSFYDTRYKLLFDEVEKCSKVVPLPVGKLQNTLSTQDIKLKVVDRIDLSKFERTKKEIKKDKENLYVIDTNVFVNCPDVISKLGEDYPILLSAKVLDELDKLKIKLDEKGQNKVQQALKSILHNMDIRDVRLEVADLSLLPEDFNKKSPDNFILSVLLKYPSENPILLTSDVGLLVKAKGLGLSILTLKELLRK